MTLERRVSVPAENMSKLSLQRVWAEASTSFNESIRRYTETIRERIQTHVPEEADVTSRFCDEEGGSKLSAQRTWAKVKTDFDEHFHRQFGGD